MANTETFDNSPAEIQLKGKPKGVSVLSRKVKVTALIGIVLVTILVMAATKQGFNAPKSHPDDKAAQTNKQADGKQDSGRVTTASFDQYMKGVSDGQAALANPVNDAEAIGNPMPGTPAPLDAGTPDASAKDAAKTPKEVPPIDTRQPLTKQGGDGKRGGFQAADPGGDQDRRADNVLQQAQQASSEVSWDSSGRNQGVDAGVARKQANVDAQLAQAQQGASGQGTSARVAAANIPSADDPNKQFRKEAFLKDAQSQPDQNTLNELRKPALSKYEVMAGSAIPAALWCAVNSDIPGQLCATVTQNVMDSLTGNYTLIPQGTRLIGAQDTQVAIGQTRILVVWYRLIFPDGSSMNLQGMPGADRSGAPGLDADVDNHYFKVFTSAMAISLFSAGVQLSQPNNGTTSTTNPSVGQTIAGSMGQQLGQVGTQMVQRQLQVQPTLSRGPGHRFNIQVTKDMVFLAPYRPYHVSN